MGPGGRKSKCNESSPPERPSVTETLGEMSEDDAKNDADMDQLLSVMRETGKSEEEAQEMIDYERFLQQLDQTWVGFGRIARLTFHDFIQLKNEVCPVNDSIIDMAQKLLALQYPNIDGLYSAEELTTNKVTRAKNRFVQIMISDEDGHWFVASNVFARKRGEAIFYDSCWSEAVIGDSVGKAIRRTLKLMMRQMNEVRFDEVTQNRDINLSGLMAIAFAEVLCHGGDPTKVLITTLDQHLRQHLIDCFDQGFISQFPNGQVLDRYLLKKPKNVEKSEEDTDKSPKLEEQESKPTGDDNDENYSTETIEEWK